MPFTISGNQSNYSQHPGPDKKYGLETLRNSDERAKPGKREQYRPRDAVHEAEGCKQDSPAVRA